MNIDVENLIDHCIEYAQDLIEGTLEFYPFGAFIDTVGNVHPLEFDLDKKKMPTIDEVLKSLIEYCEHELSEKKMLAFCTVFESELVLEKDKDVVKCISIDVKHNTENDLPLFYQSYTITDENDVIYSDVFAVKRNID